MPTCKMEKSRVGNNHTVEQQKTLQDPLKPQPQPQKVQKNGGVNPKENPTESPLPKKRIYKIVLTGGPCGGKTTGQSRMCTFFENLGWKVFRVPETATVLLSGGIKFSDLTQEEALKFQENLIRTMMQIENTYFALSESSTQNCLIICDRGVMDASAYISKEKWDAMMANNHWNPVELRDNRYNQILHLVSAANGAEDFYSTEDHACRSEDVDSARDLDYRSAAAWVGHPYFDVIDNSTNFETKMNRMIEAVCQKLCIDVGDRLQATSRKFKFVVKSLPPDSEFPAFQDFEVEHHYLCSGNPGVQVRLRKRGQNKHYSYIHTIRRREGDSRIEVKTQLSQRDYQNYVQQQDDAHFPILKTRRCFLVNNQYFQLDIYKKPAHSRCDGLILLETYSSLPIEALKNTLPKFLDIEPEDVSGQPRLSMFNLSLKEDWNNSQKFCGTLNERTGSPKIKKMKGSPVKAPVKATFAVKAS